MIKSLFDYMSSDSQLVDLIGYTHRNKRINPYKPQDREDYPYIVYEVIPLLAGEVTTQYRCDIRIVHKNLIQCESIAKRVMDLFHFRRKAGFIINDETIYNSKHAGGGVIYDPDTKVYEQLLIFNLKVK